MTSRSAIAANPRLLAGLKRAQEKLRAFGDVLQQAEAEFPSDAGPASVPIAEIMTTAKVDAKTAQRRRWAEFIEQIQAALADTDAELVMAGFAAPGADLEAWLHLARIIEVDPSEMTLREIFQHAMTWIDRETLRAKLLVNASPKGNAAALTAAPKPVERRRGRAIDVEQKLRRYLSDHSGEYQRLVPLVLTGDGQAVQEFRQSFGPLAIARRLVKGDQAETQRVKTAIQGTATYQSRLKPLFAKPPRPPTGWRDEAALETADELRRDLERRLRDS